METSFAPAQRISKNTTTNEYIPFLVIRIAPKIKSWFIPYPSPEATSSPGTIFVIFHPPFLLSTFLPLWKFILLRKNYDVVLNDFYILLKDEKKVKKNHAEVSSLPNIAREMKIFAIEKLLEV